MDSPIHRLDSRIRLLLAFVMSLVLALSQDAGVLTLGLLSGLFMIALAGLPNRILLRRIATVGAFILLMWLILPVTVGVDKITWPVRVHREGVLMAGILSLRVYGISFILLALTGTLEATELGHGLQALRCPGRLVQLLFFLVRYLNLLETEFSRMQLAARVRGFHPRISLHSYRTFGNLIGSLLVRSAERSERVHQAMLCRGFRGRFYPVYQKSLHAGDILFLLAGFVFSAYLFWLERR